jgi:4-amino-4-deoxy-L-arabinose transferase-like glycosyltransferase
MMADSTTRRSLLRSDAALLASLAFATFLLHFFTDKRYGIFRDELYYIACSKHLAWGYVDQPPLSALILSIVRHMLGESLMAIRFLPALCGALTVFLTGWITRELGGGRFAQGLAALAAMLGPVYLVVDHFYSMNCFDHLFWVLAVYVLVLILKHDRPHLWLLFGLIAGVGLMNKYSMGFLGLGLIVGLALTPARKYFTNVWLWLGGALATAIFLPHILWEIHKGFPTAEFIRNATLYKNAPLSPVGFLANVALQTLPFTIPIWLAGLYFYFFSKAGKPYRVLGWIFVAVLALFFSTNAKPYYLAPTLFMLFAAGGCAIELFIHQRQWNWLKPASVSLLVLGGLVTLPYGVPVLPVDTFIRYENFLGLHPSTGERGSTGELPQTYADMFGWENQVATVAKVYNSLTPAEKARTLIFCGNYGEAGAIDFFGKKYGLPHASSGHNSYWFWGPQNPDADIVITVGLSREDVEKGFRDVQLAAVVVSKYARAGETPLSIYIGRNPKMPLKEIWPRTKNFI